METFQFAIALAVDAESLELLRELSSQMARAAGLDEPGARRAGDDLVDAVGRQARGARARVSVSFVRRADAGPVDVEVRPAPGGGSGEGAAPVRRSWGGR